MNAFAVYFKALRMKLGVSLREFCLERKLDPGNISRMERGLVPPPQSQEKLEEFAGHLGLEKGSEERQEFFDLAAAESGRIPDDVLSDKDLVAKLPILFRTLRGQKVPDDKLNDLIRHIRRR
jgi:transcriptional regulator with XRE-family HTH domain